MIRVHMLGIALLLAGFFQASSKADLIVQIQSGDTVVFDDISGRYWYRNLPDFTNASYSEQKTRITSLNSTAYFGQDSWQMVDSNEIQSLLDNYTYEEIGQAFVPGINSDYSGRIDESMSTGTHRWLAFDNFIFNNQNNWTVKYFDFLEDTIVAANVSAWVATNRLTSVPEPSSLTMIGVAAVGLLFRRSR